MAFSSLEESDPKGYADRTAAGKSMTSATGTRGGARLGQRPALVEQIGAPVGLGDRRADLARQRHLAFLGGEAGALGAPGRTEPMHSQASATVRAALAITTGMRDYRQIRDYVGEPGSAESGLSAN